MHQIRFPLGLRPKPRWGSLQRSPGPLAGFRGPTSKGGRVGGGGRGKRGDEMGGRGRSPQGFAEMTVDTNGLTPMRRRSPFY